MATIGETVLFQPFLRFWQVRQRLAAELDRETAEFQPFLRFWAILDACYQMLRAEAVSTLLEILGLVCSVLVGF